MLKRGAQKGRPKGENKWLKHQSDRAGSIQMHLATFHENSKYHRKCLHFGSHFRSLWVPFSSLLLQSGPRGPGPRPKALKVHQNGAQGCPNGAQGCQNAAPRSPKAPKRRQSVPKGGKLEAQGTTMEPQGHPKCYKDATSPSKCHYNTKMCPKVPKNKQAHTDTNNQPTK